MKILNKLLKFYLNYGIKKTLYRIIEFVFKDSIGLKSYFIYSNPIKKEINIDKNFHIYEIQNISQLNKIKFVDNFKLKSIVYPSRILFLVLDGEVVAHYSLMNFNNDIPIDWASVIFSDSKYTYIGECYTNETYRGKNIYPFALCYLSTLAERHNKIPVLTCNSKNKASIRGIEKAGFKLLGKILYFSKFGFNKILRIEYFS